MSLAADALQPQLVRGLISLSGRAQFSRLADVITDGPGAGYDLDVDPTAAALRLDFREPNYIAAAVAGDAARFVSACFNSMNSVEADMEQPTKLAWTLVRAYYGAFYGGHAVLRLLGQSCSMVDGSHVSKLRNLAAALGTPVPFAVPAGLYHCKLNPGQTGFSMVNAGGRVGGAHEAFWEVFDAFLSESTEDVLEGHLSPVDARAVFAKLEALRRIYRRGAGASWLSAVRNQIQYRHTFGVWPPLAVNKTRREALSRLAAQWTRDPMNIDIEVPPLGDLGAFVAGCAFTASLCRTVLGRISERSSIGAQSFARPLLQMAA